MKTRNRIGIWHIIVMGLVLVIAINCKKDISGALITIGQDQDSNFFSTETIGTQVWMTKNLRTRRYQNGQLIGTTTPAKKDITSEAAPKYQWAYDGDENYVDTYGRLYTWYAATDPRNICPKGFHIPTDEEWSTLISLEAMGGEETGGGKLKEKGTTHWISPNTGATDEAGFTALPGGYHFAYGTFRDIGFSGFWWSSSEFSDSIAYSRGMFSSNSQVSRFNFSKRDGLSVRCIKDN